MLLLGCLSENLESDSHSSTIGLPYLHEAVREGIRLLEKNPAHDWTLSELAAQLHFNPCYLVRLFKKSTGLAPLHYLARYRAEQAAHLLLRSEHGIADIGALVGWSNPSHFAQRFKAHFGLTAGEYRRRFAAVAPSPDQVD